MAGSKEERDYRAGLAAGEARAEDYPDVMTHTLPTEGSASFQAGWRAGFARVRNRRYLHNHGLPVPAEPLEPGSACPAGCTVGWPGDKKPEQLRANEDGELSCPTCWDVFGFVLPGEVLR